MTYLGLDGDMTVEKCRDMALKAGYTIFSIQYAVECYGSSDFAVATRLGPSTTCDMSCGGAYDQECGGGYTHSLYIAAVGEDRFRDDLFTCWARQAYCSQGVGVGTQPSPSPPRLRKPSASHFYVTARAQSCMYE